MPKNDVPAKAIARRILARLETQQVKGRVTRAKVATELAIGAAAAAEALSGPDSADFKSISLMAYMVSLRGDEYLQEYTK